MLDTSKSVILSLAAELAGEVEKRCDAVRMEKAMVVVHDARRVVRANNKYRRGLLCLTPRDLKDVISVHRA